MRYILTLLCAVMLALGATSCKTTAGTQAQIDNVQGQRDALEIEKVELQEDILEAQAARDAALESGVLTADELDAANAHIETLEGYVRAYEEHDETLADSQTQLRQADYENQTKNWAALIGSILGTGVLSVFGMKRVQDGQPSRAATDVAVVQEKLDGALNQVGQLTAWINRYGAALHDGLSQSAGQVARPQDPVTEPEDPQGGRI